MRNIYFLKWTTDGGDAETLRTVTQTVWLTAEIINSDDDQRSGQTGCSLSETGSWKSCCGILKVGQSVFVCQSFHINLHVCFFINILMISHI